MIDKQRQLEVSRVLAEVDSMLNSHIARTTLNVGMSKEQKLSIILLLSTVSSWATALLASCRMLANECDDPSIKELYDSTMTALRAMVPKEETSEQAVTEG